ncbi:rhodanese-like domain-containing protein [Litorisediminicola beolgyonensis]|uniref:Rhodanese-like domain-containing protein n=1 Tax=Litorisediminicola beolgyonensis TaxID=1173614 RepID=A0ABW3ZEQ3_9RHOB
MKTVDVNGKTFERWSVDEVASALEANEIVLIDVRMPLEYGFEAIPGALNMPLAFFDPKKLPTQDGKRIVLHCAGGLRSEKMAKLALEAGFDVIADLDGGFGAWKEAKKTYRATDMATGAPKIVSE